jgi:hypothetical protein
MPVETKAWPARDPDAVLDYIYTIPLDAGDAVTSHTVEKLAGDSIIDSEARTGADVTVWLSGGTDGETSVYRISWVTNAGREDDAIITQLVIANETLALTGYDRPTALHFLARYPAFAATSAATIQYWLADAARYVDEGWSEGDYAPAIMAYAAWQMAKAGGGGSIAAGVTRMKSGAMDVTLSAKASGGGLYEAEFRALQRRNSGGPRLIGCP